MKYCDSRGWTDTETTILNIEHLIDDILSNQVAGPYDKRLIVGVMPIDELRYLQGMLRERADTIEGLISTRTLGSE